jgi:hypothetical protein
VSQPLRLRVPREHGAFLAVPPLAEVGSLLALNRQRLNKFNRPIQGRAFQEVRRQARHDVLRSARGYLTKAGEPLPPLPLGDAILMAGHQPELFHPGVWVKHFALCGLARVHNAWPVNLIVDYDAVKTASLTVPRVRLPLPPVEEFTPHTEPVPFDRIPLGIPHEEWVVRDEELFASLPERVRQGQEWGFRPLLEDFWEEARRQAARTRLMGERLTAARRTFERRWGCHNFELPVSALCSGSGGGAFTSFLADILTNLPHFHRVYNDSVHDYRRAHGLKSRNHPVPDLAREGEWLESPFWAWRAGQTQRGRLMVRSTEEGLALRASGEEWPALPFWNKQERLPRVSSLTDLEEQGLKIRPRALTNTLFARLFVADLFLHGIGGGKYDELTDEIIRRYYGAEPPAFLVLSGTLLLPFPVYPVDAEDCRRLARLVRDMDYNPQRYLPAAADPVTADLLAQRQEVVASHPEPEDEEGKRRRWRTLQSLTVQLRPALAGRRDLVRQQLTRCRKQQEANAVLRRRDYAFCLYPEEELRTFCCGITVGKLGVTTARMPHSD